MKRCPVCHDMALYDDTELVCPICGTRLITYVRQTSVDTQIPVAPIQPVSGDNRGSNTFDNPEFEYVNGRNIQLRGLVSSVSANTRNLSVWTKLAECFMHGEPYQFGSPVYETVIRVEEITDNRLPSEMRSLVFYGNAQGQINSGDDVSITAVHRYDRIVIRDIYNHDTESTIHTPIMLNPAAMLIAAVFLMLLVIYILFSIINWIVSGSFAESMLTLIGVILGFAFKIVIMIAPLIALLWIIRKLIHF